MARSGSRAVRRVVVVSVSAAFLLFLRGTPFVGGHLYLFEPISRPFWYSKEFQSSGFSDIEYCPTCMDANGPENVIIRAIENTPQDTLDKYGGGTLFPLYRAAKLGEIAGNGNYLEPQAISVRHGVCGDPKQNTYEGWNRYSTPNSEWPIHGTYKVGSVLEIKVFVKAYHWGHLEFFLCDSADLEDPDGVVTQECLNMHPLTRAEGDDDNSPIDPNYPGRYYVDPECRIDETDQSVTPEDAKDTEYVMHMRYQLPEALVCTRCILQMVYETGHKCQHIGYEEFEPSSWPSDCAPNKEDWIRLNGKLCGEEDAYPQEFWNCADIAITADGEPNPTPAPTEPIPDCLDPVEPSQQCGGEGWQGSECCRDGYECVSESDSYSECQVIPNGCSEDFKQCGGVDWEGPFCCWPGATCVEKNEFWSSCQPDDDD